MSDPLAYFITFHTYGTWLHGHQDGSVDYQHQAYGQAHLPANPELQASRQRQMKHPEVRLDQAKRKIVLANLIQTCEYRNWHPHAIHVRQTHVHIVVSAGLASPEKVLRDLKAYATRRLREQGLVSKQAPAWSEHGSTRYLWKESVVYEKCEYTLKEQGEPMERWPADGVMRSSDHDA